jgi:hypothetical protein
MQLAQHRNAASCLVNCDFVAIIPRQNKITHKHKTASKFHEIQNCVSKPKIMIKKIPPFHLSAFSILGNFLYFLLRIFSLVVAIFLIFSHNGLNRFKFMFASKPRETNFPRNVM